MEKVCSISEENIQSNENNDNVECNRIGNKNWCKCGHCQLDYLSKEEEYCCCKEFDLIISKINTGSNCSCITKHPSFGKLILDNDVLEVAIMQYHDQIRRPLPDPLERE